jgi:hypothetical protein
VFVAASAAALALLAPGSVPAATTFPDSSGEVPAGPDIAAVTVSNDAAGLLTIRVDVRNRQLIGSSEVVVGLDTDANRSTGRTGQWGGIEYAIDLSSNLGGALGRWNGSQWDWGTPQSTFGCSYAAGAATFRVNVRELGNTKRFNFYAAVEEGDLVDVAPDNGMYFYAVQTPAVTKTVAQAAKKKKKQ